MAYSRKRYWFAMLSVLAIVAVTDTLIVWLRPPYAWLWSMALVAVCGGLGFVAYFSRDEIQRQNRLVAWYYGGSLALLLGVMPFLLLASNTMLQAMVDFIPHASSSTEAMRHSPRAYFTLGVMVTLVAQVVGNYLARIVLRFRS
jgi:hypothetical protein